MHHIFMQNQWESLKHMTCTMSAAMVFLMRHGQFQKRNGWDSWSSKSNCQSKCWNMILWYNRYAGDDKFCCFTQQHKLCRTFGSANSMDTQEDEVLSNDGLTLEVFKGASKLPCFCMTLEELNIYFCIVVKLNNASKCEVCGAKTIWRCTICGEIMCIM